MLYENLHITYMDEWQYQSTKFYNSTFEYLRDENLHIIWMDGGDGMRGALLAVVIILHPHHPRIHMLFMFLLINNSLLFEKGSAGRSGSLLQICVRES